MIHINDNFALIPETYLFSEIAHRIAKWQLNNPDAELIRMGIGDVTMPICPAAIDAMHKAVNDMADAKTFHGYGPEQGYEFLRKKIAEFDYHNRGINISESEIFVGDGAKSDTGNFGDIFGQNVKVAVTDPVYPVYIDTNAMAGRAGTYKNGVWSNIIYLPCSEENNFVPQLPSERPDLIYLCYPNNPTGTTLNRQQLRIWVDYALENESLIMFDSAYEAFITDSDVPHSIYEIEGAEKCAIEFRSFSKTAGFTGLRCGYTVVPHGVIGQTSDGEKISLNKLWNRRQCTKFNGASYIVQRGAEAIYSFEGRKQIKDTISYYLRNAELLRNGVASIGLKVFGGLNAPYIWVKTPDNTDSWQFFDEILHRLHIAGTPGVGFGPSGEGFFRLTAFNTYENTVKAVERLKNI